MPELLPSLLDSFEFDGTWISDVFKDGQCGGRFSFTPAKGSSLVLHGRTNFLQGLEDFMMHWRPVPEIEGELTTGAHLKISNALISLREGARGGFDAYSTYYLFSGQQALLMPYDKPTDQDRWQQADFCYDALPYWLDARLFKQGWLKCPEDLRTSFNLSYDNFNELFPLVDCGEFEISHHNLPHFKSDHWESVTLTGIPTLRITTKEKQPLEFFQRLAAELQTLLTLLVGKRVFATRLMLKLEAEEQRSSSINPDCYILVPQSDFQEPTSWSAQSIAFPLAEIRPQIDQVFKNFRDVLSRFELIIGILMHSHILEANTNVVFKMSAVLQALEGFHRSRYKGQDNYLPEADYTQLTESLKKQYITEIKPLDSRLLNKFKGALEHNNQFSYNQRLNQLCTDLPDDAIALLTAHPNKLRRRFVVWRNRIAHTLDADRQGVPDYSGMTNDYFRAFLILQCLVWQELGLPNELFAGALQRTFRDLLLKLGNG